MIDLATTNLPERLRDWIAQPMPLPAGGKTPLRHRRLMEVGRDDLSLARLAEAHWDAVAILAEAGREAESGAIYGVWTSEISGQPLTVEEQGGQYLVSGKKRFCSGAGIVDRALLTAGHGLLLDVDLRDARGAIQFDDSAWKTAAFAETKTSTAMLVAARVPLSAAVGRDDWYLKRPGFWHGACGPAACWAGGAAGLLDYALQEKRNDPHTLAHLGAIAAEIWALHALLETAGGEIDGDPEGVKAAQIRALTLRHLVEQASTNVVRRIARAYGPHPLSMNESISRRYVELDLYLRQSHAERDLEALGRCLHSANTSTGA